MQIRGANALRTLIFLDTLYKSANRLHIFADKSSPINNKVVDYV
jgi:hypothetical protein